MVHATALLSLRRPSPQTYKAYKNHFNNVDSHGESTLGGIGATILDDRDDLLALVRPAEEDRLTKFLRLYFPMLFLAKRPSAHSSVAYISGNRIRIFVGIINILLAAILLFGAIYNLYYVRNDKKRLGLIAGYTVAFALCMGLLSGARRSEIFGACAAYAAVLVVFVSGNLGSENDVR